MSNHMNDEQNFPIPVLMQKYLSQRILSGQPKLCWENEAGGQTYSLGDFYLKWNPRYTGIDLHREYLALQWIAVRHVAPHPVNYISDAENELLISCSIAGEPSHAQWGLSHPYAAIRSMAEGLRSIHALDINDFPLDSSRLWYNREINPKNTKISTIDSANAQLIKQIKERVIVHGDACSPNTIIHQDGSFSGNVDFGDLGIGSRWADLAVASLSLQWNFLNCGLDLGEKENVFFTAYGIIPDWDQITHYRRLWEEYS